MRGTQGARRRSWRVATPAPGPRLLVLALVCGVALPATAQVYDEVVVVGDVVDNGIFDPSVEYLPDGSEGWLFYSAVSGDTSPWGPLVETRVARSVDHGQTWTFAAELNLAVPDSVTVPGEGSLAGIWNYEVASVAYDPNDAGKQWKMFAHRIFRPLDPNGSELLPYRPQFSWIMHRSAPHPAGPWSAEVALFGSGAGLPAPFVTEVDVNAEHESLAAMAAYSEPGAFFRANRLYVSLTGLVGSGADRVVLLVSPDHGVSWDYQATLVTNADMAALGFQSLDGTAIVAQAGRVFLLGTPKSATLEHHGTIVFEFQDLSQGVLRRTPGGDLFVVKHVPPQPALISVGRGGGQADFHEQNAAGMLQPQLDVPGLPLMFRIFETSQGPMAAEGGIALLPRPLRLVFAISLVALSLVVGRARPRPARSALRRR